MERFPLGALITTCGVAERISTDAVFIAIARHAQGDWGDVDHHDRQVNERAVKDGSRLMSVYRDGTQVFWVITEANRSSTTVILPEEY